MPSMEIYVAAHKPYAVAQDPAYRLMQVGSANPPFTPCSDSTGDNISHKNASFCELTAMYWIWKNSTADVVGLVHYRRYFARKGSGKDLWQRIASGDELLAALDGVDLVLPKPRHYVIETNYSQYAHAHYEKDLLLTRQVITELCPDYAAAFDTVMAKRSGHRFNMMVMHKPLLDKYCSWLFPILFELERRIDTTDYDAYNSRVIGFLAERLLDVWLLQEGLTYKELPVVNMEGENWPKKGFNFIKRKLVGTFRKQQ